MGQQRVAPEQFPVFLITQHPRVDSGSNSREMIKRRHEASLINAPAPLHERTPEDSAPEQAFLENVPGANICRGIFEDAPTNLIASLSKRWKLSRTGAFFRLSVSTRRFH
ncbi:hypothetical protein TNCT_58251 [Trichonephila clavata]|uniref:Uncharacterized protein n=1 Tax=Trichonephila clavata TaxID=2740835 RepID=A0A8X6F152_TRICU|nr:hypothetical protein TNCT_58251 [Trichonephila clavata]